MLPKLLHFVHLDGREYVVIYTDEEEGPEAFTKPGYEYRPDDTVDISWDNRLSRFPCDRTLQAE